MSTFEQEIRDLKRMTIVEQGVIQFFSALNSAILLNSEHLKEETKNKFYLSFADMLEEGAKNLRMTAKKKNKQNKQNKQKKK